MTPPPAGIFTGAASCVTLAAHIIDLLTTAKSNKDEFRSLLAAVQSICAFLEQLPSDGITSQGNSVLCELSHSTAAAAQLYAFWDG